ncbi:MAG: type II toxin-antitoxin system VapB family antitoxin [Acidobacteria bacterium]|nr:type II toxin-antitoxin system VapB family antitoxin [Acidobacteriota bacterium]
MSLRIDDPEICELAEELAEATGESLESAVRTALEQRLHRVRASITSRGLRHELAAIRLRCSRLPVLDDRSADEILGYDDLGLFG